MTCGNRDRGLVGASSTSGQGRQILFCAVLLCWTDGIKSCELATSTGVSHRSITFRSVLFLLQLKMWFTSCGATSHLVLPCGATSRHNAVSPRTI